MLQSYYPRTRSRRAGGECLLSAFLGTSGRVVDKILSSEGHPGTCVSGKRCGALIVQNRPLERKTTGALNRQIWVAWTKMALQILNRKARFDYEILETIEAGLELQGTEVKSIRAGKMDLADAFARIRGGEIVLFGAKIAPYENAGYATHDQMRPRKMLLHSREIVRLASKMAAKGLTLVPLKVYFKRGWAKVLLGLARGKQKYDKREAIRKRETQKEIQRATRRR